MNKKILKITLLHDKDDTSSFWKNKTYLERIRALEKLRRLTFGYAQSTQRLQRVLAVTQLKKN